MSKQRKTRTTTASVVLAEEQLEQVTAGLLPAVQKVRETAANTSSSAAATESLALNFTKITY